MKLTKDDFSFTNSGNIIIEVMGVSLDQARNEILKNQEDAEKWRKHSKNKESGEDYVAIPKKLQEQLFKESEIVERLKKRIEEIEKQPMPELEHLNYKELQKILGEEK